MKISVDSGQTGSELAQTGDVSVAQDWGLAAMFRSADMFRGEGVALYAEFVKLMCMGLSSSDV